MPSKPLIDNHTSRSFSTKKTALGLLTMVFLMVVELMSCSQSAANPALIKVTDIPLPGRASRFDYQDFDPTTDRLYFTHMGDGELVVVDTKQRKVIAHLPGFPTCTGLRVVPELHRLFVSVAGLRQVSVVDTQSLKILSRVEAGRFPDGLAYAPQAHKIFVSDESGGKETVIDTLTNHQVDQLDMGGEIGNTQYDPVSHRIDVNVQDCGELVEIDPDSDHILARHALKGGTGPHGLLLLGPKRLAFVACEDDARLLVIDLNSFQVKQVLETGRGPDVLAYDPGLQRLYVATESDIVSVFHLDQDRLRKLQDLKVAPHAHSIEVNPKNHEVYLPLQNINGRPVLRVMMPPMPLSK